MFAKGSCVPFLRVVSHFKTHFLIFSQRLARVRFSVWGVSQVYLGALPFLLSKNTACCNSRASPQSARSMAACFQGRGGDLQLVHTSWLKNFSLCGDGSRSLDSFGVHLVEYVEKIVAQGVPCLLCYAAWCRGA